MADKPVQVQCIGVRGARPSPPVDITDRVTSLNHLTDAGSGEVASASIMLDCFDGAFLVEANSGATPLLAVYDEMRITVGWPWDTVRPSRVLYVSRLLPQRTSDGMQLTVELLGREDYLRQHHVTGRHVNRTYVGIISNICGDLLTPGSLGSGQPQVNCSPATIPGVPAHATGNITFGQGERSSYDLLMEVLGRLNRGVSAGGAGDLLSLTFADQDNNDIIDLNIRSMGGRNSADAPQDRPVIDASSEEFESCLPVVEQQDLNTAIVRGQQDFGSVPRIFAWWRSAIETYDNYPEYSATAAYVAGLRVLHTDGNVYERLAANPGTVGSPPTNTTNWRRFHFHELMGANTAYSPWTAGRAQAWQNMASNPTANRGTSLSSPAYPDGNLSISDGDISSTSHFRRDWVAYGPLTVANRSATPPSGYGRSLARGDRILCSPTSSGTDAYGKAYANSIAALVNSRLVVVRPATALRRGDQVAVLQTGRVLEWQWPSPTARSGGLREARNARDGFARGPAAWRDVSASPFGADCFHRPTIIENVQGFLRGRTRANGTDFSSNSAIRIVYQETINSATYGWLNPLIAAALGGIGVALAALTGPAATAAGGPGAGAFGWWATLFMAPWPPTTAGGETRGSLFTPSLLDLYNSNVSASGATDLYATHGEELGETSGISFLFNFDIRLGGLDTSPRLDYQGDFPFKIFVYDADGNVWVKEEVIRFLGETQQVRAFWSEFRPWRARAPLSVTDLVLNWTTPERLELERLNERRVKMITIQFDRPYDEFGRYAPWSEWDKWFSVAFIGLGTVRHIGTIDALHFMKDEVYIAKDAVTGSVRSISDPVERYPDVSNSLQLANIATVALDVGRRQVPVFVMKQQGRTDVRLDDTVYYRDELMVPGHERLDDLPEWSIVGHRAGDVVRYRGAAWRATRLTSSGSVPRAGNTDWEEVPGFDHTRRLVVTRVQHTYTSGEGWLTTVQAIDRAGA